MRSVILILSLVLLLVWQATAPVESHTAREFGLTATQPLDAAHMNFKPEEWRRLSEGGVVTRALAGSQSKEIAGFGAVLAHATPQSFIKTFDSLSIYKGSENTLAYGRFSQPPVAGDLAGLEINERDLQALMRANLKDSGVKLTASDIARIRTVVGNTPVLTRELRRLLAVEYKALLLEKARSYHERGEEVLAAYVDQAEPVSARDAFAAMFRFQAAAAGSQQQFYSRLSRATGAAPRKNESFLYWALQKFGQLKPVISIVAVSVHQENRRSFIVSKQIYSSHYTEAGLGVAELIPFRNEKGEARTLAAYTIRLQVDILGGLMGVLKKRAAQPQMLETLKISLEGLRRCAESLR